MELLSPDERIADILVDAFALGDGAAARKWNCSIRSIYRYRARLKAAPSLAAIVIEKRAGAEDELATMRVRFLRKALVVLEARLQDPEATIHEIVGAVKIVGELHQVAEAMDEQRPDSPYPDALEVTVDAPDATH